MLKSSSIRIFLLLAVCTLLAQLLPNEAAADNPKPPIPPIDHNSPISYIGEVADGLTGQTGLHNINSPSRWNYYYFCANVGDVVTLQVDRTTSAMDPAMSLYFGVTDDSEGLYPYGSSRQGMTFVAWADDNNGIPHGVGGNFADPIIRNISLPSTGIYTLAVYDYIGMGPAPTYYDMHIQGIKPCLIPITIDIKPGETPNPINPKSKGVIPVAILGSNTFDVATIDVTTLAFGPNSAKPDHEVTKQDVNGDGFMDLVAHYRTQDTGIGQGDTKACLTTKMHLYGIQLNLKGCDSIKIVGM